VRKGLNTGNWELATEMTRSIETGEVARAVHVSEAVERFLADAIARNLSESSLKKYRVLLQGRRCSERTSPTLEEFAEDNGYQLLNSWMWRNSAVPAAVEGCSAGSTEKA
jgi:hypothetical protein